MQRKPVTTRWLALLLSALFILAACRATDMVAQFRASHAAPTAAPPRKTRTPTVSVGQVVATETPLPSDTETPTETAIPTETAAPTQTPAPTLRPVPTRVPVQVPTAPPVQPAVPVAPTPAYPYEVSYSDCRPNVQTYIEGIVYQDGVPEDGLLVRISQGPDGLPDPNSDDRTGSHAGRPGYYFQAIDVHRPHGGTWYLWLIDPSSQQRISDIAIVKTDPTRIEDNNNSPGSCQTATVNFSNQGSSAPTSTTLPSATPNWSPTPTRTGTLPTSTPTRTATPTPTATPTATTTP